MTSATLLVVDTVALASCYAERLGITQLISDRACEVIRSVVEGTSDRYRLSFPSIVLIEFYDKWLADEEQLEWFRYEVFQPILSSPFAEVRGIDREVVESLHRLDPSVAHHDIHDRLILAIAVTLEAPIITNDPFMIAYLASRPALGSTVS